MIWQNRAQTIYAELSSDLAGIRNSEPSQVSQLRHVDTGLEDGTAV